MPSVELTKDAENDLADIWTAIGRNNPDAADRLIDRFTGVFEQLAVMPFLGPSADNLRPGLRVFAVEKYALFYRPTDAGVLIYRVLHGRRNFDALL